MCVATGPGPRVSSDVFLSRVDALVLIRGALSKQPLIFAMLFRFRSGDDR